MCSDKAASNPDVDEDVSVFRYRAARDAWELAL